MTLLADDLRSLITTDKTVDAGVRSIFLDVLNAKERVVLAHTLRAGRRAGLDDTSVESDSQVGNGRVFSLTRAVRHHDSPVVRLSELGSLDRFGDRADLVDLEQKTVASLLLDGRLDAQRVRNGQVVTDDSDAGRLAQDRPGLPVILVEGVFNRRDGVLLNVTLVDLSELGTRNPLAWVRVWVLEVKVVLAILVELRAGHIKRNVHAALVASHLDRVHQQVQRLISRVQVRCETALVTNVRRVNAVLRLDDLLQRVVDFCANLHRLCESLRTRWHNHEFLESKRVTSVRATVDDVHSRGWQDVWRARVRQARKVLVQGHALLTSASLGNGDRHT